MWQHEVDEQLRNQDELNNPSEAAKGPKGCVRGPRSSLKPLGKPLLFGDAINAVFPIHASGLPYQTSVETSNGRIARIIIEQTDRQSEVDMDRWQNLKIQIGRYRSGEHIPTRAVIKQLAPALGVPPMVLLLYAGRYEEFFGYVKATADLPTSGGIWPEKRPSPLRYALALGFSTFPRLDADQSHVARQTVSAIEIFSRGSDLLSHDTAATEDTSPTAPLAEFLAASTTDGSFLLPHAPARKDISVIPPPDPNKVSIINIESVLDCSSKPGRNRRFALQAEAQVDSSAPLATWIFNNLEPAPLLPKDTLYKAADILNDKYYPTLDRFDLAAVIFEHWANTRDHKIAADVLEDLWRWSKRGLSGDEAAELLRRRSQKPDHIATYIERALRHP